MSVVVVASASCFTTHYHLVILILFLTYLLQVMVAFFCNGVLLLLFVPEASLPD